MATVRPGPLVTEIHGSIGGSTFQHGSGSTFVRARTSKCLRPSSRLDASNALVARAANAWASLSGADQAAWTHACSSIAVNDRAGRSRNIKPFQLFLSAFVKQTGSSTIVIPSVPSIIGRADPIDIIPTTFQGDLVFNALSRDLAVTETTIVRVLRQVPARLSRPLYKIHETLEVESDAGLGLSPDMSIHTGSSTAYAFRAAAILPLTSFSLELWFNSSYPQTADRAYLFAFGSPTCSLYIDASNVFRFTLGAGTFNKGLAPTDAAWHYLALTFTVPGFTAQLYLDGTALGAPNVGTVFTNTANTYLGRSSTPTRFFIGFLDDVRFSDIVRTPTEIASTYNAGHPPLAQIDATTLCLLRCDEISGGLLLDSAPSGFDFNANSLTLDAGVHARRLYATADRVVANQGAVWTLTQALDTRSLTALSVRRKTDW